MLIDLDEEDLKTLQSVLRYRMDSAGIASFLRLGRVSELFLKISDILNALSVKRGEESLQHGYDKGGK